MKENVSFSTRNRRVPLKAVKKTQVTLFVLSVILALFAMMAGVGVGAEFSHGIMYSASSNPHQNSGVPQVPMQCSLKDLNIPMDGKWNDAWKDATKVSIPMELGNYKYSGQDGYAFLGLKCDQKNIYGYVEYYPPADNSGNRNFIPGFLSLYIDSKDSKTNIPVDSDHSFSYRPIDGKLVQQVGLGVTPTIQNNGGWTNGVIVNDGSAKFTFSVTSTPSIFKDASSPVDHPLYEFQVSKEKYGIHDTFGLGTLISDGQIIDKNDGRHFVAIFPANDLMPNDNIVYSPNVWADVYMSQQISSTTTHSLPITTKPITTSTHPITTIDKTPSNNNFLPLLSTSAAGLALLALGLGYGLYQHKKKRTVDNINKR